MKAQFKFLSGARAGELVTFTKHYIGIGRHPLSDVRFDAERDLDVSSRHASVMRKTDGFMLQDLNSKNGTFVGGMMTFLWVYEGELDATGKVLTLNVEGPSFAGDGTMAKYQDIIEIKGPNERTLSSQVLGPDGKWNRFMMATYTRI